MRKKVSSYFARRVREAYGQGATTPDGGVSSPGTPPPPSHPNLLLGPPVLPISPRDRLASASRGARMSGSAYGYRPRHGSQATYTTATATGLRRGSNMSGLGMGDVRQRRGSARPGPGAVNDAMGGVGVSAPREELSLAQRLLIGEHPPFSA